MSYREEVEQLPAPSNSAQYAVDKAAKIAARADAEIAALRVDAERYRWLRQGHTDGPYVVDWHGCMIVGEDADEEVDAARGEGGGNG